MSNLMHYLMVIGNLRFMLGDWIIVLLVIMDVMLGDWIILLLVIMDILCLVFGKLV